MKREKGITLVEILMRIAILSVVFGLGVLAYQYGRGLLKGPRSHNSSKVMQGLPYSR